MSSSLLCSTRFISASGQHCSGIDKALVEKKGSCSHGTDIPVGETANQQTNKCNCWYLVVFAVMKTPAG